MPKTTLQRQASYYERIIEESRKSPLTPKYKEICKTLKQLVDLSKKLNDPEVKMSEVDFAQLKGYYQEVQNACRSYFETKAEMNSFEKNREGVMKGLARLLQKDMDELDKCNPKEPGSLSDIIGRSRSHTIVLKGDNIAKVGGALNTRIPLKTPSGKKVFYSNFNL